MNKIFRLGELFSGAGGMALGSQNAKQQGITFEHVWANDMDKYACETFRKISILTQIMFFVLMFKI